MATVKTGYDNALDFDPASGIIKYGQYEFFANQVVKPSTFQVNFDNYLESKNPNRYTPFYGQTAYNPTGAERDALMKSFVSDVQSGAFTGYTKPDFSINSQVRSKITAPIVPGFRELKQIDANTFDVTAYEIPTDIEFVNNLNKRAADLNKNAALGQVTDASRPTPGNARLGKPNYSRAATVLAGQQSPLGGAKTTLGS